MINNLELFYILNGTEISLQNQKNQLFLTLETSSPLNTLLQNKIYQYQIQYLKYQEFILIY